METLNLDKINLADVTAARDSVSADAIRMNDPTARVRLSNSTISLMRGCERRFQMTKLLRNDFSRDESAAMSFGKGVGAGSQLYMVLRTKGVPMAEARDAALYACWLSYHPQLEDDRRFLARALDCLEKQTLFLERMLTKYRIAELNGRLANELSFNININERYYFVGYLDLVVQSKETGRYMVVDNKTTSMRGDNLEPNYKNSDQTVGYSIALDAIAKEQAEFDVGYWVTQLPSAKADIFSYNFHEFIFPKRLVDRFQWFMKLLLDVNNLKQLEQLTMYPTRGNNCMNFNKVCPFYSNCQNSLLDEPAVYEPDPIEYDFTFDLTDLILDHQKRLAAL